MNKGNQKGITLIALIITIIVMLILLAVTARIAINSGLFGWAKNSVEKMESAEGKEEKEVDYLKDKLNKPKNEDEEENENYELNIEIKVPIYNVSVGEVPAVFSVKGTKNRTVIYENIVATKISSPTPEPIKLELSVPEGTKLEVTSIYDGGSYTMAEVRKEVSLSSDKKITVSFENNYNYTINKTSTAIISFSGQSEYRN